MFKPEDPVDLAATIEPYFASDLFANLSVDGQEIKIRDRTAFLGRGWPRDYGRVFEFTSIGPPTELANRDSAKVSPVDGPDCRLCLV